MGKKRTEQNNDRRPKSSGGRGGGNGNSSSAAASQTLTVRQDCNHFFPLTVQDKIICKHLISEYDDSFEALSSDKVNDRIGRMKDLVEATFISKPGFPNFNVHFKNENISANLLLFARKCHQ